MQTYHAVFYRDPAGHEPMRELVVSLDAEARSAIGRPATTLRSTISQFC